MEQKIYSKWNLDRQNYKWNINELLRLEREYDLLELSVGEIAKLHQRTANAIAMKLQSEGIISNYKVARGFIISSSDNNSDSGNRNFSAAVYDNENFDSSSEYIPSESESESEYGSDSDSNYSPECYYSGFIKNELSKNNGPSKVNITIYDSDLDSDSDSDSSVEIIENNNVTQRVDKLETSVSNMEGMLTKLYNFMKSNSSSLNMGYDM